MHASPFQRLWFTAILLLLWFLCNIIVEPHKTHYPNLVDQNVFQRLENTPQRGTWTDFATDKRAQNKSHVDSHEKNKATTSSSPSPPSQEDRSEDIEELLRKNDSLSVEEEEPIAQSSNETETVSIELVTKSSSEEAHEVDTNASTVLLEEEILDDTRKEKDQLETYSQFAERVLAEKKNGAGNGPVGNGQSSKGSKVKSKNYASTDCGAKFIAANPEASHSHKIINSDKDEYMLNKCSEKSWVVVELCESIKPQKFDIANFELFSNLPKEIQLYGSHRYPTREWVALGTYLGEEGNRGTQSFHIENQEFLKFIRLEIHSHYGTEFYCPLSQFRMYGMSEFEVIEEESEEAEDEPVLEDEEEGMEHQSKNILAAEKEKDKRGIMIPDIFKAIFNGVLEVIKRGSRSGNLTNESELIKYNGTCKSLKEEFTIKNESCHFADSLNYILACYYDEYLKLMFKPFIHEVINNLYFCKHLATIICSSPQNKDIFIYDSICNNSYACVMLSPKHILAMCHMNNPSLLESFIACDSPTEEESPEVKNLSISEDKGNLSLDIGNVSNKRGKLTGLDQKLTSNEKNTSTHTQNITPLENEDVLKIEPLPKVSNPTVSKKLFDTKQNIKEDDKFVQLSSAEKNINVSSSSIPEKGEKVEKIEKQGDKKKERKIEKSSEKSSSVVEEHGTHAATTATPSPSTAVPSSNAENRVSSHANKESIVVRLSNKIKVLEHNMSISSQYLEELSRRYKSQMEEMERQFNITIHALNRTSQTAYERDVYHQKRIEGLEGQVERLSNTVETLIREKEVFLRNVFEHHIILLIIQILVMSFAFSFCMRRMRAELCVQPAALTFNPNATHRNKMKEDQMFRPHHDQEGRETPSQVRRRSIDSIKMENSPKPKERRFSGQASVKGTYDDLMISEADSASTTSNTKEKRKKKKKIHLKRSMSNVSMHETLASTSISSKKEGKLEKLKKSCAGVLFSGENAPASRKAQRSSSLRANHSVEDINGNDWQLVKRNKGKKWKKETNPEQEEEQNFAFSSDLKRGKITVVEEPFGDVYQHPYYGDMIYDDYIYKAYIEEEYKDYDCNYETPLNETNGVNDVVNRVYTATRMATEFDYNAPVINDYYYHNARDAPSYNIIEDTADNHFEHGASESRDNNVPLWNTDVLPKPIGKPLRNTSVPPSLKGKTRLRSDNWEWYSSQPSRLLPKSNSTEITSNSSSDSNGRAKPPNKTIPTPSEKFEKKKKKKKKGKLLVNGESH